MSSSLRVVADQVDLLRAVSKLASKAVADSYSKRIMLGARRDRGQLRIEVFGPWYRGCGADTTIHSCANRQRSSGDPSRQATGAMVRTPLQQLDGGNAYQQRQISKAPLQNSDSRVAGSPRIMGGVRQTLIRRRERDPGSLDMRPSGRRKTSLFYPDRAPPQGHRTGMSADVDSADVPEPCGPHAGHAVWL